MFFCSFLLSAQWLAIVAATLNATVAPTSYNGSAVPTSTTHPISTSISSSPSPANHSVYATSSVANTSTSTSTAASSTPTSNATSSDPDILTITPRRIDFIIAQQSGASSLAAWLSTLGPDGKWPDSEVDYTTGCPAQRANWPAEEHWVRIAALAAAWHGGFIGASASYVKSPALLAQIASAIDWWFARDFTEPSCLDTGGTGPCPCGTPGLWNTNWFSNVIGIPHLVGSACLLLSPSLTPTQLSNCTNITGRSFALFERATKPGFLAGANTLDIASIGIAGGVLMADPDVVADAYARVHAEVQVQVGFEVDGILEDGSFAQHSGLLYNGNYGMVYTNDVLELEIEGGGTRFAATGVSKAAFEQLMDASQWMIYQNSLTGVLHWDFSTEGRFISFPVIDQQATGSININLTEIKELATLWNSTVLHGVYTDLTKETGNANVGRLVGNRFFWNNDYMVTRGKSYVSTLKMYSTRTRNAECTNSENPLGFHLADGTVYTYITGDEYEDIAAAWDWNMIPGTTVDYGAVPLACATTQQVGVEDFVGGVSTGTLGLAVMRYTNPITQVFSFQKAWFFFENDVHHVSVTILTPPDPIPIPAPDSDPYSDPTTVPVFSVLDQRKHTGPIYVDYESVSTGNYTSPTTLFHASTGYLFAQPAQLSIVAGNRTGPWSALGISPQPPANVDLFAAWIPHDFNDADNDTSTVSYSVFPGRTREAFYAEAATTPLQTLCADSIVSAVHDRAHGTAMVAFWQPEGGRVRVPAAWRAGCEGVTVTADSALVMILDRRTWKVTVADPTQALEGATLTFDVGAVRPRGWGRKSRKTVWVAFPAAPRAGAGVSISLVKH